MTNKVKVRIAVAVDASGKWRAIGNEVMEDSEAIKYASHWLDNPSARYWIEAELPLPTEATVVSDVVVR